MAKKKETIKESKYNVDLEVNERVKGKNEMIQETLAWMNWEKVVKVMEFLNWTWNKEGVPDSDMLKEKAFDLLDEVYDQAVELIEYDVNANDNTLTNGSGGLEASVTIVNGEIYDLGISFVVESSFTEAVEFFSYEEK